MTLTRRHLMAGAGALLLAGALPGRAEETVRLSGRAFGTGWQVTLAAPPDPAGLGARLTETLAGIDRAMSPFRPETEISRLNAHGPGRIAVSPDFARVGAEALRIAALTDGAFDPTVGPDVARFGFGPIAGARMGSHRDLAAGPGALEKRLSGVTLDLCGIAKGFGLDAMAATLLGAGVADFFIEFGGEVLARGHRPGGGAWRAGIADPIAGGIHGALVPGALALATSGDAVNAYEVGGRRYSHIIDPATGEPVDNAIASVSVLAETAMTADALATALMVMGPERGLAFAEAHGLPALYLLRKEAGLEALATPQFHALRV